METSNFLVLFTFLLFQTCGTSSNTMFITSSNVTCIERERQSLLLFKQSLTDKYNLLSTWKGAECCKWERVGCDGRNGHVVKLDLRSPISLEKIYYDQDLALQGELSHSLQNLKHLQYLDLSMNGFSGNIPEFLGSFQRLQYLNLSASGFGGAVPHYLGNLSRLQYLDLKTNFVLEDTYNYPISITRFILYFLTVDDLGWVSSLSSLRYLDLSGITIGKHTDWFHPLNKLPSLLTLNLAWSGIKTIPSIKSVNFTSLNSLDLSENFINSTIPLWLSNLTDLVHLNLFSNNIHGKIPDFLGMFSALASIDFSTNSFETTMPDLFCNLSSLVHLDLYGNMISGPIPANLGQLSRLEDLYLGDNQLSGNIPMSLGQPSKPSNPDQLCNFSSLVHMDLSENMLSGPIPSNLGLLSKLKDLYLHHNQLSGNIPMSFGQLSKLKHLDLSHNLLVGFLSETHFTNIKILSYLDFSGNSLVFNFSSQWIPPFQLHVFAAGSCNIGPHFPNWLQTQTNLHRLDISNSSIRDTIPEWFESILYHVLDLDLSNNQIGGKLPEFHGHSMNQFGGRFLKVNSNKFEGSLTTFPSNMQLLDLSDNLLSGNVPHTDGIMNPNLEVINLSKNRFTGRIPIHLCKVPSIWVLDLSQNKFSGKLPDCLGNLISLQAIDLSNNTISGVVPSSLGSLSDLISLHLRNNRFEGEIPVSFQNLTNLITMDLGSNLFMGNIPLWIGEKLSNLKILNLPSNKFIGQIPLQLCQLKALQQLNLAKNNIIGTIPHCFGNLSGMIFTNQINFANDVDYYVENILASMKGTQLVYTKTIQFLTSLDLSSNNIIGDIPDVLMNLVGLKNLNLSRNQLKGHIPMMIGNLSQMESLDLSMNMLSGQIPQSLIKLNFLSYLNLSFNNLSGAIPVGNQLQTLVDPSIYEGNDGLCGPPLSRSCSGNNLSYNHVGDDEDQIHDDGLWSYSCIGLGFIVGFMGLLGSLQIIRNWRVAYFDMLENVYDWLAASILVNLACVKRTFF
ncbi:receptor-like protein EIX2 [Bidens hawaiensis]|uniref:receptor-like protein EIX2 n=1 Tax=Bidens hawaiensis TaxID=980011 RepID=UPI0040495F09